VIFLSPRASAQLVPKFHVALHTSHATLPKVSSKFGLNVSLPTLICKCHSHATLPTFISKPIPTIRSKAPAKRFSSPQNEAHNQKIYLFRSLSFTLSQMCLYKKDERALSGNQKIERKNLFPPANIRRVSHYHPPSFPSLSLSRFLSHSSSGPHSVVSNKSPASEDSSSERIRYQQPTVMKSHLLAAVVICRSCRLVRVL
jgi:hypothetical protein